MDWLGDYERPLFSMVACPELSLVPLLGEMLLSSSACCLALFVRTGKESLEPFSFPLL
jgi:hypothetical protein